MSAPDKPETTPAGKKPRPADAERGRDQTADEVIDEAGEDSFPASDPPAYTSGTGAGRPPKRPNS